MGGIPPLPARAPYTMGCTFWVGGYQCTQFGDADEAGGNQPVTDNSRPGAFRTNLHVLFRPGLAVVLGRLRLTNL
jgi:hypothetical protein